MASMYSLRQSLKENNNYENKEAYFTLVLQFIEIHLR